MHSINLNPLNADWTVEYLIIPGHPETKTDPAEPPDIEIKSLKCPGDNWNYLVDIVGSPRLAAIYSQILERIELPQ